MLYNIVCLERVSEGGRERERERERVQWSKLSLLCRLLHTESVVVVQMREIGYVDFPSPSTH